MPCPPRSILKTTVCLSPQKSHAVNVPYALPSISKSKLSDAESLVGLNFNAKKEKKQMATQLGF
jgi:hypothetical protein